MNTIIFVRKDGESEEELIYRVCSSKDAIGTWDDVADILNDLLGYSYSESKYRKAYQNFQKMLDANQEIFSDSQTQLEELVRQTRELEKEKVKVRRERNEYRRLLREQADRESYKEQIINSIKEYSPLLLDYDKEAKFNGTIKSNKDALISLFDVHAGIEINNFWNSFNEDILRERLNKYLDKIFEVQLTNGCQDAYVVISELTSGFIHPTLRIENNQDMIDQFLISVDYVAQFLIFLSQRFDNVNVYVAMGNHGRLSSNKKENITHENMDSLIIPFLQSKLQNYKNITCFENEIEQTIAMFNIRGNNVFSSHGDRETPKNAIEKLTMFTSIKPDIYLSGHMHTNALTTIYDSKCIKAGCLSGSDSYCMDKRLRNRPEQIIAVIDEDGLDCLYDVKF